MYTQKASGVVTLPERNISAPKTINPSPPKTSQTGSSPAAAPRSIAALVTAAGLPADKLSASIVSFARFFSLPIKPELMTAIRRQAFSPSPGSPPSAESAGTAFAKAGPALAGSSAAVTKSREALALAAAAAQDKGAELTPKGLERFAEAIEPDWQRHDSGERNSHGQRHKEQKKKNVIGDGDVLSASHLKEMVLEAAEKDPLLAILNRLPGRNGQRWVVLPFGFSEAGKDFKVSLRVLIDGENPAKNCAKRMVLDIAEFGEIERHWLFVPEAVGSTISRLTLYIQPEHSSGALAQLAHKVSQAMEIPPNCVFVRNYVEYFPGESENEKDLLCAINEAV